MLQGSFVTDNLYWTRWLFYGISCPLLAFEISKRANLNLQNRVFNIFLTVIIMVTGTLSSISTGPYKIFFFIVSTISFIILMNEFYKTKSKGIRPVTPYIVFGWCVFPIVFILSNEGIFNVIPVKTAAGIYLALDMFTKIIFYLIQKKTFQQEIE
jgi:bacteriorhodopsin